MKKYKFVEEFRNKVVALEGFDYHDPKIIHSNDCEFIDGFHGGDVTYQRILLDMAEKDESLKSYVDMNILKKSINKNSNKTLTIFKSEKNMYLRHEIDFLEIGCKK